MSPDMTQVILTKSLAIIMPSSTGRLQSIVNFSDTRFFRGCTGFLLLLLLLTGFAAFSGFLVTFFFTGAAAAADFAAPDVVAFVGAVFASAVCAVTTAHGSGKPGHSFTAFTYHSHVAN